MLRECSPSTMACGTCRVSHVTWHMSGVKCYNFFSSLRFFSKLLSQLVKGLLSTGPSLFFDKDFPKIKTNLEIRNTTFSHTKFKQSPTNIHQPFFFLFVLCEKTPLYILLNGNQIPTGSWSIFPPTAQARPGWAYQPESSRPHTDVCPENAYG